jgi:IS605 OrfB family transposase
MQRTISIKIDVPEGFLDYLKTCSDIFNRHVEWCFQEKSTNKVKAHHALYYLLREEFPNIPSSIIQTLRDTACEAVKQTKFKFKPTKKSYSAVRYNARNITLRGNLLSFSSSLGRIKQLIKLPNFFQKRYQNWKFQAATIGYSKQKGYVVANLTFTAPTPQTIQSDRIVGIDRGLYNIVSLSDGQVYSSQQVRKQKRKFLYVKRQLQAKGTRSAKRLLKKRSGREKRFSSHINHCISKWLANQPYDTFVLEDLTGIRKQNKGRQINGWLSNWTFHQLETFLQYKAEALGKQIAFVDARYTSQKCSNCGEVDKKNRNKSRYCCGKCRHAEHADINAAKNIKANYLLSSALEKEKVEQAAVNQPYVSIVSSGISDTSHQPCAGGN